MNIYHLIISGPEALILQELLSDRISSLEHDIAEDPGTGFDEAAAMKADLNYCNSLLKKLNDLVENSSALDE